MAFRCQDKGHAFQEYILHIFHNGWMDCRDSFMLFFAYIAVIRQNIAEYEVF